MLVEVRSLPAFSGSNLKMEDGLTRRMSGGREPRWASMERVHWRGHRCLNEAGGSGTRMEVEPFLKVDNTAGFGKT